MCITHIAKKINSTADTATNANGRLLRVDDGTGYQIFSYDKLGNISENIRTFALPFEDSVYNFRMLFEYDSWNRVQRIVYPDSEVVTYNYDLAGNLNRVHTYKANRRDTLIKNILYDEFGHRTQVNFGNGVTTNYTYDILQRLSLLETQKPNSPALQKISYTFDLEDNITRVANSTAPVNGIGGSYTFDYQYDNLYRLTSSTGNFTPTNASYYLEMHYTPAGRICRKEQGDNNASKRLLYGYNPTNAPHAARRIYDPTTTNLRQMLWDANGNIAQIAEYLYDATNQQTFLQDFRNHYWDEDDRLNMVLDNSHFSYYLYGNDGQRVAKLTGSAFTLGTGFATNAMLDNYTLYPSEYLVITQQGYTKYYYANGTRIASRLGSGGFEKMTRLCTLDQNLTANANTLFNSVVANIGTAMPNYHISDPCPSYYSDIAGFRVQLPTLNFEPNFGITAQQNVLQAFRQNYANEETYYFHGNHLGSANWVTLQNASPTQFLLHLPYGEEFVKQLSGSYDERFTFTGKEKDIETGYYYFGARFDNVDLGFMSVDPVSDKYPSLSPYAYCAWNPVKLVDPTGMDWFENEETGAIYYNNKYGKDAAGKGAMKGSGWKHLGGNNMFSNDGAHNSDISIVTNNGGTLFFGKSGVYMELSLNGERAKSLMESLGYKQVPTQVITYNDTYTETYPAAPGHNISITYGVQYEYTEKMAYVPKSYVERSRKIIDNTEYGDWNDIKYNMPYANRETISYYEPCTFIKGLKTLFSGLNTIHGGLHDYVNYYNMGNISRYKGDNDLINKILNR